MTDAKSKHHNFDKHIPEEAREHMRTAHQELHKSFETLLPPGFIERRRTARAEMLKAAQVVLGKAIERLEEKEA